MSSNNRHTLNPRPSNLLNERLSPDNIKRRNAKQLQRVKNAMLLEHLRRDRDSAVDRVRDDEQEGLWGVLSRAGDQVADDAGVDLEEVVAGHAWFAGDTCWDHDDVCAGEGGFEAVVFGEVAGDFGGAGYMA